MKKKLCCILTSSLLCACVSTTDSGKATKIALAYKKEGDVFRSQGNYTAALAKLLEAEKVIPNDPYLQNSLGLTYMRKDKYEIAVLAFKRAISLKPDYTEAVNNLGAAYLNQEKWDTAIAQFKIVLQDLIYPTPHFPLANIGWAYIGKKNYSRAQFFFLKALEEKPRFVTAIHGITQTYLRSRQTDRAVNYLHKWLKRMPDTPIFHADMAEAYENRGQVEQAVKAWKLVVHLSPENSNLYKKAENRLFELED